MESVRRIGPLPHDMQTSATNSNLAALRKLALSDTRPTAPRVPIISCFRTYTRGHDITLPPHGYRKARQPTLTTCDASSRTRNGIANSLAKLSRGERVPAQVNNPSTSPRNDISSVLAK